MNSLADVGTADVGTIVCHPVGGRGWAPHVPRFIVAFSSPFLLLELYRYSFHFHNSSWLEFGAKGKTKSQRRRSSACMLFRARGAGIRPATVAALGIGCLSAWIAVGSRSASSTSEDKMAATSAITSSTTKLADIAGASLRRLPTPTDGTAAISVKAASLWRDRPSVVLVLRRPG